MDITKRIHRSNKHIDSNDIIKMSNIQKYKRCIDIFINYGDSPDNIEGEKIIKTVSCILTNYSVSISEDNPKELILLKAIYICELSNISKLRLNDSSDKEIFDYILNQALFKPDYGFISTHKSSINDNIYVDYGLTLIELGNDYNYFVLNFSDSEKQYLKSKSIGDKKDVLTPKFYTKKHKDNYLLYNKHSGESNILNDYVDNNTEIKYIPFSNKCVMYDKSRNEKIRLSKKIIKTQNIMEEICSSLLTNTIEKFEFIYNGNTNSINIKNVSYYDKLFSVEKIIFDLNEITANFTSLCSKLNEKHDIESIFFYGDRIRDRIRVIYRNGNTIDYELSKYCTLIQYVLKREEEMIEKEHESHSYNKLLVLENMINKSIEFGAMTLESMVELNNNMRMIENTPNPRLLSYIAKKDNIDENY